MRLILAISVLLISAVSCNVAPDDNEVAGGTFVGYSFSEQAVVDAAIEVEADYTLTFKAYDLGGDARFVVYVQREISGEYFAGVIRLGIEDPDGNVYTHYHSAEAEAIDRPILWKRRVSGVHNISVEFAPRGDKIARATFEVPLSREPVSGFVVIAISVGVLLLVAIAVFLIRKRS